MSQIYGELPTESVLFAACDSNYFIEHAPAFIYSADDVNKNTHIHVVNPTPEVFSLASILTATTSVKTTFTFHNMELPEVAEMRRTYYACIRFLIAPTIIQAAGQVLILDIDGMCMNDFSFPEAPVGYFPREPLPGTVGWEREGTMCAAGAVYYNRFGIKYAEEVANQISGMELKWFVDQIALSKVLTNVEEAHHFDAQFMDWEFKEGTTIWTGKGPRKYDNPTYVNQKNSYRKRHTELLLEYDVAFLKPRLDLPFKNFGVTQANDNPLPEIRTHWQNFWSTKSKDLESKGLKVLTIEMPRWMFHNSLQDYFGEECEMYVPHVEKKWWGGNDRTIYYMQTVFPWLFTTDPLGWAGGSEYQYDFSPMDEYTDDAFNELSEYFKSGKSKFGQPEENEIDPKELGEYIFVPLQLPHDETIKWHSDVTVEQFVEALCNWSDNSGVQVVFKGHPVNLGAMEPLKGIMHGHKNVKYYSNVKIKDMIEHAAATYVINSGTGQEAMLLDATVVTFGYADYDAVTINGKLNALDLIWEGVKVDNAELHEQRKQGYRKWYHWFKNITWNTNVV